MDPLRSALIKLAHSNPSIRPHILPLVEKRANDIEDGEIALGMALENLLLGSGLPKDILRVPDPDGKIEVSVPIPKILTSLFETLHVKARRKDSGQGTFINVEWVYTHPSGGSNGFSIGTVSQDPEGETYWRGMDGKARRLSF